MIYGPDRECQFTALASSGVTCFGTSLSGDMALGKGAKTCTPKSANTCVLGFTKDCRNLAGVTFSLCCLVEWLEAAPGFPGLEEAVMWLKGVLLLPLPVDDL